MNKILLVEDDIEQQFLFQKVFELKGLPTITADQAEDVFRLAREEEPALILLDIALQGKNGLDLLAEIKEDEQLKKIPVVIFTNTDKKDFRERSKQLGAIDFIVKVATTPQAIAEKIKGLLEQS